MVAGLALSNLLFLLPMQAQLILPKSGETLPSFEVATIKPAPADAHMTRENWVSEGPQMDKIALGEIIRDAYDAHSKAQLVGGPQALLDQRFDLRTKIDPADVAKLKTISPNERSRRVRLMLQALLRDRFQLKMHVETRELPAYALMVAKGGPKPLSARMLWLLARSPIFEPPANLVESSVHGIPHALLGHDLSKSLVDAAGSGVFLRKLLKIGIGPLQRS
jgi:hypothetical protein